MQRWRVAMASEVALAGSGGVRQRQRRRCAAAACGFSPSRDGTLRGEMKRYVKDMSGDKFAGRSANLCFYDQHTYNRVKNRVKKT